MHDCSLWCRGVCPILIYKGVNSRENAEGANNEGIPNGELKAQMKGRVDIWPLRAISRATAESACKQFKALACVGLVLALSACWLFALLLWATTSMRFGMRPRDILEQHEITR